MSVTLNDHIFYCNIEVLSWFSGGEYDLTENLSNDEDYQPDVDWDFIYELYGSDDDKFYALCDDLESTIKTCINRCQYTSQDMQQLVEEYSGKGITGYQAIIRGEDPLVDKLVRCTLGHIYQTEMFN